MEFQRQRAQIGNCVREVVARTYQPTTECERLGGRVRLVLECGHVRVVAASKAPVHRMRCLECEAES